MSRLPEGSLVLVTGGNGYIGSHVVDQALKAGFNVRVTVREAQKADWLKEYVEQTYGSNRLEVAVVPDMAADGAFKESVKGTSACIHTASNMSFSEDPEQVIPGVLKAVEESLEAANTEPGMKQYVYCSSSSALFVPPSAPGSVDETVWNEESIKIAYEPAERLDKGPQVYAASKTLAEKAVWKWAKEHAHKFTINTVLPNMNWGLILAPGKSWASSGAFMPMILKGGGLEALGQYIHLPPQYHVDVQDTARLHVAPMLDSSIRNERIMAFGTSQTWNDCITILQKLRPDKNIKTPSETWERDQTIIKPLPKSVALLQRLFGRDGFTSLEESINNNIQHVE